MTTLRDRAALARQPHKLEVDGGTPSPATNVPVKIGLVAAPREAGSQIAGCLPVGFDLDSMLTPDQFCAWQQVSYDWFIQRRHTLPGVFCRGKITRINPREYLNGMKGRR